MHDKFHGHGGSYVVNPETQERELVHRTLQPGEDSGEGDAKQEAAPEAPAAEKTVDQQPAKGSTKGSK